MTLEEFEKEMNGVYDRYFEKMSADRDQFMKEVAEIEEKSRGLPEKDIVAALEVATYRFQVKLKSNGF